MDDIIQIPASMMAQLSLKPLDVVLVSLPTGSMVGRVVSCLLEDHLGLPLPLADAMGSVISDGRTGWLSTKEDWTIRLLECDETMDALEIHLEVLYCDHQDAMEGLADCLCGRLVYHGCFLSIATRHGLVLAVVLLENPNDCAIRVQRVKNLHVDAARFASLPPLGSSLTDCPGYDRLRSTLEELLCISPPARPSGILLTGCASVGKTGLVESLTGFRVHWVSIDELLLRASWSNPQELKALLTPPMAENVLVVLDSLQVLSSEESLDQERRMVMNAVMQAVDELVARGNGRIVGIGRTVTSLPAELVKADRLEKHIEMTPPGQRQRETIILYLLESMGCSDEQANQWSLLLATMTAGCVAGDLRRLVLDASARAVVRTGKDDALPQLQDLAEASRVLVPSELALLDLTKPQLFSDHCMADDWPTIHQLSWQPFAGSDRIKRLVFRTIVAPWRRHLQADADKGGVEPKFAVSPPSGVLFYGASGCGKTLAAQCLGSSLGLPMIKIRATDVLNKWLGGSEAVIRSLFARARSAAPCILFLDEIDAIGSNRPADGDGGDVGSRLLSTLLNEMDGVSSARKNNVVVIACTNRLSCLDAALLRPGRLEAHVELHPPNESDALEILRQTLGRVEVEGSNTLHLETVARRLVALHASAAAVHGVAREAVLQMLRTCSECESEDITLSEYDFEYALSTVA